MTNDKPDITGSLNRTEAAISEVIINYKDPGYSRRSTDDVMKDLEQALAEIQAIRDFVPDGLDGAVSLMCCFINEFEETSLQEPFDGYEPEIITVSKSAYILQRIVG